MNRRDLLTLGVASGTTGVAGLGLGYQYHGPLRQMKDKLLGTKKKTVSTPPAKFRPRS